MRVGHLQIDDKGIPVPPECYHYPELHNYLMKLYLLQLNGEPLPPTEEIYERVCHVVTLNAQICV